MIDRSPPIVNKEPPFRFDPTDQRCLQCCFGMALAAAGRMITDAELDKITSFEPGLNTQWSILAVQGRQIAPGLKLYTQIDFAEYAKRGEAYLRELYEPEWFELQKSRSSPGFKKEQAAAQELINVSNWSRSALGPQDLASKTNLVNEILDRQSLLLASVNVKDLYGTDWNSAHAVLAFRTESRRWPSHGVRITLHDPAFENGSSIEVMKNDFVRAIRTHLIEIPRSM